MITEFSCDADIDAGTYPCIQNALKTCSKAFEPRADRSSLAGDAHGRRCLDGTLSFIGW